MEEQKKDEIKDELIEELEKFEEKLNEDVPEEEVDESEVDEDIDEDDDEDEEEKGRMFIGENNNDMLYLDREDHEKIGNNNDMQEKIMYEIAIQLNEIRKVMLYNYEDKRAFPSKVE